nr:glutathione S-transferase family protein [Hyphomonas sp. Mor2]
MTLKLFHSPGTRSIRTLWLLEEMGLEYELISIDYDPAYFASDAFRKINPMGKIPALIDDGNLVIESTAIAEYLLRRYGPSDLVVPPDDPEFGTYIQWFHMAESGIANYVTISFCQALDTDPYRVSDAFDQYCRHQISKSFDMLEKVLADREYLLNRGFSAADISLGYTLFFARMVRGIELAEPLKKYLKTLMRRPAMRKSLSDLPSKSSN